MLRQVTEIFAYLLTADNALWKQTQDHVGSRNIDLTAVRPAELSPAAYLFYRAAEDVLTGSGQVRLLELGELSSPDYKTVANALRICARGWRKAEQMEQARWK